MENRLEDEMDTVGIQGFKELSLSYYVAGTILITIYLYSYNGNIT